MNDADSLANQQCRPRTDALDDAAVAAQLRRIDGWTREGDVIVRTFSFPDYYRAVSFVNALAWMIHAQDHHPEILLTYNRCTVRFNTHSVNGGRGGISQNDFICAARANALYADGAGQATPAAGADAASGTAAPASGA